MLCPSSFLLTCFYIGASLVYQPRKAPFSTCHSNFVHVRGYVPYWHGYKMCRITFTFHVYYLRFVWGVRGTVVKLRWQGCKPSHCGWVSILSKETLIRKVQRNWKVSRMSIQYYNAEQDQCVGIFFQILHWLHANTHQIRSVLVYSMEGPIGEWATYGTVDLTRVVAWFMLTLWKSGREWGKSGQMPSTRLEIYQQSHSHSFSLSGWKYWLASTLPN